MIYWKNEILSINDILKSDDDKTLNKLLSLTESNLEENDELSQYIFDDLLEEVIRDLQHLNWSINQEELSLYFDKYEMAAGVAGLMKVDLPIKEVFSLLNDETTTRLSLVDQSETNMNEQAKDQDQQASDYLNKPEKKYKTRKKI